MNTIQSHHAFTQMHKLQQAMGILAEIQNKGKTISCRLFGSNGIFDIHIYDGPITHNTPCFCTTMLLYEWGFAPFNDPEKINNAVLRDLQSIADGMDVFKLKSDSTLDGLSFTLKPDGAQDLVHG